MNLTELKKELEDNNVPERWYSIDEGLKPDACNLYKNYSLWEYFYLSEKGERMDCKIFDNDNAAYEHLLEKMKRQLKVFNIAPKGLQ